MKVRIVNKSSNPLPSYTTAQSSGLDLQAHLDEPITLQPMGRALISTGIFIELPDGFEAQVRPRSGLAINHGITVLNTPGTIDADYRGEIKVILINLSDKPFTIRPGDRIAQLVISSVVRIEWDEVHSLQETIRGEGGFGHSGI
ncbi:MAG: dUTP diphosphatase [Bacteroidales bacterium]|nr:dUTP diphosphatase [Bacteroidales bacterium]